MSSEARPERFRFFIFTCRDPETDFRRPLVDALRHHYETWYIWLRRRPLVSGPTANSPAVEMSLPALLRLVRRVARDDRVNVYFNSTNTYFPGLSVALRLVAPKGVWCLDMHDDLRYHNTGLKRWREGLIISLLRWMSHVTVHAAPSLQELFPDSHHLGNASNILPLAETHGQDKGVLIIASFDERFDFDFLSGLALKCPAIQFHLHGWVRPDDTPTMVQITAIVARHPNLHYHGPYKMADLPAILRGYRVSVAPYRTDTELTRYIDPLRFYHCLNAGLEVVSTDIPQARHMRDWVHVVSDVSACADALTAIRSGELAKQPAYTPITWEQRADRLVEILRSLPRTDALLKP
ncbi:MAG TPA: hypothetical protein VGC09_11305 [Rhodopila sp.]